MRPFCVFFCILLLIAHSAIEDLKTEEEALAYLAAVEEERDKFNPNLITKCVELSWWKAGEKTITLAFQYGIDISNEFSRAVSKQRANIQKLQNVVNKNKEDYAIIAPTFQWAQGKAEIKMNVKLSHKWDTPATLGCSVESVKFEPTSLYFEAKCPNAKKKFVLNLNLMKRINPELCSWSESAVGRVLINLKKTEYGLWDNIIVKHPRMPKNIHTWWSMKDQLEKEDREKEEAEEAKLEKQRIEAEKIYWEEKKKEEQKKEAEKAADEQANTEDNSQSEQPAQETVVKPEKDQNEVEL